MIHVSALDGNLSGVVLAGGRSMRMGGLDKGLAEFDGAPLVVRTLKVLEGLFKEVIIVTNQTMQYALVTRTALMASDFFPARGPLGGIHAALARTSCRAAFCVACDMPYLSADFIRQQAEYYGEEDCDILVPRVRSRAEPLHGIYQRGLLVRIERILTDGADYSIQRLLRSARTRYLDLQDSPEVTRMFTNINLPQDLHVLGGQSEAHP